MSKTKFVIASLVTAGVIFAGALPASAVTKPTVTLDGDAIVASQDVVAYTVADLNDTDCKVKTVLGSKKETLEGDGASEVSGTLVAPKYAGKYKLTSTVVSDCGNQNGKSGSTTVQVGDKVIVISHTAKAAGTGFGTRVTGTLGVDGEAVDVTRRITATVNGKVFTFKTNDAGEFKIALPSATFTTAGKYRVTLSMGQNTSYFFSSKASFVIKVK